jgi:VWFA-related protein
VKATPLVIAALGLGLSTAPDAQRFSSGVEVVAVDVLVTDGRRTVAGLAVRDFDLRDDGVLQSISQLDVEQLPLNIVLVVDTSFSVAGARLTRLKSAAATLLRTLRDRDRAALMAFSHRLQLQSPLTADRQRLQTAVESLSADGSTVLRDAAFAGLALRGADPGRTLMLVFSDGVDTGSFLGAERVLQVARKSDVVVYAVTVREEQRQFFRQGRGFLVERASAPTDDEFLESLTEETGGRIVRADRDDDIEAAFGRVLDEFRNRYVLSYSPRGVRSGGWHTISVTLKGHKGKVTARRGYYRK